MSLRAATFFPRLQSNMDVLREAHGYIGMQARTGYDISPAAEWLLDNFHTIEAQFKEIHEGLPRSFFRSLPMLTDAPLAGLPRIYGVAWAFVAHTDGAFDEQLLTQFLLAYQETRELRLCEIWALPTTLRVVLIENLRRLAERVATNKAAREVANICFDRIASYDQEALDQLLALLTQRGVRDVFLTQMAQRLHDRQTTGEPNIQLATRQWLRSALPDHGSAQARQSADQAADNLSVSNAVTSLRAIGDADWTELVGHTSVLMRLMLTSSLFASEDTATRDQTLHAIESLSKRSKLSELEVAQLLLELMGGAQDAESAAPHHWLRGGGQSAFMAKLGLRSKRHAAWKILGHQAALPAYLLSLLALLSLLVWGLLRHHIAFEPREWTTWAGILAMLFPASEVVVALVNRLISESTRPQHLPRLAFVNGIPPEHRVLVAIPCLLTSADSTQEVVNRLELHYLANPEPQAQFALLSDWGDADAAHKPTDPVTLDWAVACIDQLNVRYPRDADDFSGAPRFIVLHRDRKFCESEQRWMGWERKRGKLEHLVSALATGSRTLFLHLGDVSRVAPDIPYIVTLDSDTQLPPGRLRELVGVAAHPNNKPRLNANGTAVEQGYGILQPRIVTPLPAVEETTWYHWLFSGQRGTDPYSMASSEIYQDLFSEGAYTGKALLHVKAMHAVLTGRLPENLILSHDLLEGAIARCAVVTDLTLIEDSPSHADVAASRMHRWMRGDWQLLPVLAASVLHPLQNPIRAVNLWKMVDNLRRSLIAPMSLVFLLITFSGFFLSPWLALMLVFAAFVAGPMLGAVAGLLSRMEGLAKRHFFYEAAIDILRAAGGGVWQMAQLLQQSLLAINAIALALYRTWFSHRGLLQWTTAAAAQSQAKTSLPALLRQHWIEPAWALALLVALQWTPAPTLLLATAMCLLWAGSPVWIWWASRPGAIEEGLSVQDAAYLENIARDSWRLFERCVVAQDNYLPPDNVQSAPFDMVAHRTSPTNIGLYLLSVACAREFGWIGTQDMLARLENTLATLQKLERHQGHFLNWYDTQTCAPLLPAYVSTVDSGNLSGHLLAVAQACLELTHAPLKGNASKRALEAARVRATSLASKRMQLSPAARDILKWALADYRTTRQSAARDARAWVVALGMHEPSGVSDTVRRLRTVADALTQLAWEADFSFLYHPKRHLLHIGYRVAERQLDTGFYDLLASESRLTSLLAIAKGEIPARHWVSLGRPFFAVGTRVGLRSWTGSMFEYLMPGLVLEEPRGSVLWAASECALREQMAYAKAMAVPWGISESAYAASDHTLAYQYAPQGVPRLALRRTPADELVIAPYATALAAMVSPQKAAENFRALEALGARGRYGFVEALDYTPSRREESALFSIVDTAMAHHQGMSIVALANVLLHAPARRWGMTNAPIRAVASLLHERVPREVSVLNAPPAEDRLMARRRRRAPGLLREVVPGASAVEPTHLLSNGRYCVSLRSNGAGWSQWGQTGITRRRNDILRDAHGTFFYVRRAGQLHPVSLTQHPAPDPQAAYRSVYHADRVCFESTWPDLQSQITVWVSPEDDIELRTVELRNLGNQEIDIELMSYCEVTLAAPQGDESHPAFSNMFVRAEWSSAHQALLFQRQPRLEAELPVLAAHFLATTDPHVIDVRIQTDRLRWLGRNRSTAQPLAASEAPPTDDATVLATGLDPVAALVVRVRIAPQARLELTYATAASDNAATLHAVMDKYRQYNNVARASLMSATLTGIRLRALRIRTENLAVMQTLSTALLFSLTQQQGLSATGMGVSIEPCDRRLLWRFGISGDRPIILVSAIVPQGLGLLRSLAHALHLWSWSGVACDLVVVNSEPQSYMMTLQREITALKERHDMDVRGQPGSPVTAFHLLRSEALTDAEFQTLRVHACLRFQVDGRPLTHHVQDWVEQHELAAVERDAVSAATLALGAVTGAALATPTGGFTEDAREYQFAVSTVTRPQRPWVNVLSNPQFGALVSESGSGNTWAINSRLNQLTAWSNDAVADPPAEWFLLQDRRTRNTWSATPNAWAQEGCSYQVRHGQGYTTISHRHADLEVALTWCVDVRQSVKHIRITLANRGARVQRLRLIGMVEWIMGATRADRSTVLTAFHQPGQSAGALQVLTCTQRESSVGFGSGTAFFCTTGSAEGDADWTCDRREFLDARGYLVVPDHLGQREGVGLDPCAALSLRLDLLPGETCERVFLLGYAASAEAALQAAVQAASVPVDQRMEDVRAVWDPLLGSTTVKTPDPLFDALVNRWLLYQTVTCRLWAKAGFYQAGGATGFRDQLQDAMALAWAQPSMLRAQIVVCASRQFEAGDVQHWWHAPLGAGVRTRFSDDLLWLPYACAHYLRATADLGLLDQRVGFLEGPDIAEGREDAYYVPVTAPRDATVFEHAARTIDRSLQVGAHGLPLMGGGDWNDGMNRVGIAGRGESVWLGWFLCQVVKEFAPWARARGEDVRADAWEAAAAGWKAALTGPAWDGQWFKRAYFDDGQALGSHTNPEAKIDLIAQAWSVLSHVAPLALQRVALDAVDAQLVDRNNGFIKLLDPPLGQSLPSAGYIQAYPPGVRENGGQYSHAGIWALMAVADLSLHEASATLGPDDVYRYFTYLSPAHRASHATWGEAYGIEPYVVAGDVYTQPPYVGRGGWSWYTGAAAWMHRAAIESMFGLRMEADRLVFHPCLPTHWQQSEITLQRNGKTLHFLLVRVPLDSAQAMAVSTDASVLLPGQPLRWPGLPDTASFVIPLPPA
ncbi:MAG: glucoamylase family protein [Rhodoferax sp.]